MIWIQANAFFLGVALLFYALLGGADFGAGLLEIFMGDKHRARQREIIAHAISPVWEANHMWLVLAIVILFVGFPRAYAAMSVTFHIPLTLLLLGIILRGCAFTFRQYDAVQDSSQQYYGIAFRFSSALAPLMLGIVAGGLALGHGAPPSAGFRAAFVDPWWNLFCVSLGLFTCTLFAFLAAVYLIGESDEPEIQAIFLQRARISNVLAVAMGAVVFAAAELDGFPLVQMFFARQFSLAAMVIATLALIPLWWSLYHAHANWARIAAAAQVAMILLGWFNLQYPVILNGPQVIELYTSAAPEATQRMLLYALLCGSALIFPALFYLLRIFKWGQRA